MLVWHYIVLIFRIQWLVVRRDVDLIIRELVFAEVFKKVCVSRPVEVHVSVVRVFGLLVFISMLKVCCENNLYHVMRCVGLWLIILCGFAGLLVLM
jgi:hypothetical protein